MRLKVCGATTPEEVRTAEQAGADYVGLWFGMGGHRRSLTMSTFRDCVQACSTMHPVAVCVGFDPEQIADCIEISRAAHVQLHGFTTPAQVARLRPLCCTLIKTLHVADDGTSPEARWIDAYDRAGVDVYLIDHQGADGTIGSAGVLLPNNVVRDWLNRLAGRRIWLAGGLTPIRIEALHDLEGIEAVDVDSAAREDGKFAARSIAELSSAVAGTAVPRHAR